MSELEASESAYWIYGSEIPGGITVQCQNCDAIGNMALTIVTYQPTEIASLLGIPPRRETIPGGVSWRGGQSDCNHQVAPVNLP